ncbi:TetR family transcriptional regulator [Virgibacillus ainsalahensis]
MPKVSESYKAEKKKMIVQASKNVFETKGYHNVSMKDIIQAANVSRATIYSYFKNVEDIFLAVLDEVDHHEPSIQSNHNGLLIEHLNTWLEEYIVPQLSSQSLVRARSEYFYVVDTPDFYSNRYIKLKQGIKLMIHQSTDHIHSEFENTIASYIISFVDGLLVNASQLHHEDSFDATEQIKLFLISLDLYIKKLQ